MNTGFVACCALFIAAASTSGPTAAADSPAASLPSAAPHRFILTIEPPAQSTAAIYFHNHAGSTARKTLIQRYIAALNDEYVLNRDIPVLLKSCTSGEVTGYYPASHRIVLCDELAEEFYQLDFFDKAVWADPSKAAELTATLRPLFATYGMYFVFLHEVGHTLISEFEIPVPGNQEYVADEFAVIYAIDHDQEHDSISSAMQAQEIFEHLPDFGTTHIALDQYFDIHPYSEQRYVHIRCLLSGQDPAYLSRANVDQFSDDQLRECRSDYRAKSRIWKKLLSPYRRP